MPQSTPTAPAVESPFTEKLNRRYGHAPAAPPRPIVTFRVVIRETGAALRRSEDLAPLFGAPADYRDQLCEFPSEPLAVLALEYARMRMPLIRRDQWDIEPQIWTGATREQENALLCRMRDTMIWLGLVEAIDYLSDERRGMAGLPKRVRS